MAFLCFIWIRILMGGWYYLLAYSNFNQLKIKILRTYYLLTYLLTYFYLLTFTYFYLLFLTFTYLLTYLRTYLLSTKSYWVNPPTAFSDILHLSCSTGSDSTSEDYRVSTKICSVREPFSLVMLLVRISDVELFVCLLVFISLRIKLD